MEDAGTPSAANMFMSTRHILPEWSEITIISSYRDDGFVFSFQRFSAALHHHHEGSSRMTARLMASSYTVGFSAFSHLQRHETCMLFCIFVEKTRATILPRIEVDWASPGAASGTTADKSVRELEGQSSYLRIVRGHSPKPLATRLMDL